MPKTNGRGRSAIASGLGIIVVAVVVVVPLHRPWSWPLFLWGFAVGPVACGWAYYSTQAFGRRLTKQAPAEREDIEARARQLWSRYWATYASIVLIGAGVGTLAAGLHNPLPDIAFTVIWVLIGVVPPLIAYPVLKRRVASGPPSKDQDG